MKTAVFAYSRRGCETARQVLSLLEGEARAYTIPRLAENGFLPIPKPSKPLYGASFAWADALIFIGSCGIAVREIAPYVKDKRTDPAVICIDELGKFVIALLCGHIGGANGLAVHLAEGIQAIPVVTTATDINRKFSADSWAAENGLAINSMEAAKAVSAAILEENVPVCSDFPIVTELPSGVISGDCGSVGICITCFERNPFQKTLRLIPPILHLGIGCRKGTEGSVIRETVDAVLRENHIDIRAIKCAASIDLKAEEEGLLSFCAERSWPVTFYSPEQLQSVEGEFSASAFVKRITGIDNVCERAALMGAESLIVKKTARNGVTVAVAAEHWEVHFGKTDRCGHWPR